HLSHPPSFSTTPPSTPPIYTLSLHDALPIFQLSKLWPPGPSKRCSAAGKEWATIAGPTTCTKPLSAWLPNMADEFRMIQKSLARSEEHTSELQSRFDLVCRLLLEKKKQIKI